MRQFVSTIFMTSPIGVRKRPLFPLDVWASKITLPRRRSAPERTEEHPRQLAGDDRIGFSLYGLRTGWGPPYPSPARTILAVAGRCRGDLRGSTVARRLWRRTYRRPH